MLPLRRRYSLNRFRGSHMDIDQIDPIDPVDPVDPIDVHRDIAVV